MFSSKCVGIKHKQVWIVKTQKFCIWKSIPKKRCNFPYDKSQGINMETIRKCYFYSIKTVMNVKSTNKQLWNNSSTTSLQRADWVDDKRPVWSANHDWVNGGG